MHRIFLFFLRPQTACPRAVVRIPSIIRPVVEPASDLFRFDHVDKGVGIRLFDGGQDPADLFTGNHRIEHVPLRPLVTADPLEMGRVVIGEGFDPAIDHVGLVCDDQQRMLLIPLVQDLDHLRRAELEDDRVQRPVKAEQQARRDQNTHVPHKDVVPRVDAPFLRKINGDKIPYRRRWPLRRGTD